MKSELDGIGIKRKLFIEGKNLGLILMKKKKFIKIILSELKVKMI